MQTSAKSLLTRKFTSIHTSLRQTYTRITVLALVGLSVAIAMAHGQKDPYQRDAVSADTVGTSLSTSERAVGENAEPTSPALRPIPNRAALPSQAFDSGPSRDVFVQQESHDEVPADLVLPALDQARPLESEPVATDDPQVRQASTDGQPPRGGSLPSPYAQGQVSLPSVDSAAEANTWSANSQVATDVDDVALPDPYQELPGESPLPDPYDDHSSADPIDPPARHPSAEQSFDEPLPEEPLQAPAFLGDQNGGSADLRQDEYAREEAADATAVSDPLDRPQTAAQGDDLQLDYVDPTAGDAREELPPSGPTEAPSLPATADLDRHRDDGADRGRLPARRPLRAARRDDPVAAQFAPTAQDQRPTPEIDHGQLDPTGDDLSSSVPAGGNVQTRGVALADRFGRPPTGRPGPQTIEGPQASSLMIEKTAPAEIQVGQPARFEIHVRNTGRTAVENVMIRDEIPLGATLADAQPEPSAIGQGAVYWEIGTIAPGEDVTVAVDLTPSTEGTIGSVATVASQATTSVRTRATRPQLVLEHTAPREVLVGEPVAFSIKLSNPGSGAARNVVVQEDVPVGLRHDSGSRLEYEVGTIEPGQTRQLELSLQADRAGHVINKLIARADGGLDVEDISELDVVAPQLQVAIDGPTRRFLQRPATFTVTVANPGTAAAENVELVAGLPRGLKFVSTNNSGYYDQQRHAVIWSLERLPAREMGRAQFTAVATEMGDFAVRATAKAEPDLAASQEHKVQIDGIAALLYTVTDKIDPVEVGGQTTYEIKVTNQGSKAATNVQFAVTVPEGLKPLAANGPTTEQIDGQEVHFEPLAQLPPKGQAVYRVLVQGAAAGDHRFRVQMISDDITTPVIKEESTRVYSD